MAGILSIDIVPLKKTIPLPKLSTLDRIIQDCTTLRPSDGCYTDKVRYRYTNHPTDLGCLYLSCFILRTSFSQPCREALVDVMPKMAEAWGLMLLTFDPVCATEINSLVHNVWLKLTFLLEVRNAESNVKA